MIHAKKSLGQNFLISPHIAERMADAACLQKGDTVLEIGPGKGILTKALLARGAQVIAVEKDDALIPILKEKFSSETSSGQLTIIHGDILDPDVFSRFMFHASRFTVVANIPYYITGEIIRTFLSGKYKPSSMTLMVQKEVADRILDSKESILSLSVKVYGTPSRIMKVSRGNFYPEPNVDSAVIEISSIKNPFKNEAEEKRFFEVVRTGFGHKRKLLASNLKTIASKEKIAEAFETLNIEKDIRSEKVPLEKWVPLSKSL